MEITKSNLSLEDLEQFRDEEGYIDLDAFDFKIDQREIYIESLDIKYDSSSDTYFYEENEIQFIRDYFLFNN